MLGPAEVRALAAAIGFAPSKRRGQNFVVDANTVRRIVATAGVSPADRVLEIGPGLGSLTLALLAARASVVAVEVDPELAAALPRTAVDRMPDRAGALEVVQLDALALTPERMPGKPPGVLVANLPYNLAVPLLLTVLERFPSLATGIVMVQAEVGHRLVAPPGSRTYGVPSVKAAWWAKAALAGTISRSVFWPAPHVDSVLVSFTRRAEPGDEGLRRRVFALVDTAFAQRRKTLRAALAGAYESAAVAEAALREARIDPGARGETLALDDYVRLARVGT